ncbi:MAG: CRISPR-associated protein Csm4 [Treponemataceae bacterium]
MHLYRITIELLSSLITPLKGDTIWGHIVWGIAYHEGEKAVAEFLENEKNSPQFVVSSAFPYGLICKPYPKPPKRTENLDIKTYSKIKKMKKMKYRYASEFLNVPLPEEYQAELDKQVEQSKKDKLDNKFLQEILKTEIRMHNSIDRYTGTVNEGMLFSTTELWAKPPCFDKLCKKNKEVDEKNNMTKQNPNPHFDIYVLSSFSAERIKTLFSWGFENGFGADASTGKGHIQVTSIEKVQTTKTTNYYMALAPFALPKSSELELRADVFLRTGKIGGAFASYMNPYKKTVLLYAEGAVIKSPEPIKYVGSLLTDIHSDSRICQAGYAPVIPIEEEEEA